MFDDIHYMIITYFDAVCMNDKQTAFNMCRDISSNIPYGKEYYMFTISSNVRFFVKFVWYTGNKKQIHHIEKCDG